MKQSESVKEGGSIARHGTGFTVAASPLNAIKFELGAGLVALLLVWLLLLPLLREPWQEVLALAAASSVLTLWLLLRVRAQLKRHGRKATSEDGHGTQ